MKLLVLAGQGVKLNPNYISETTKVEVVQNNDAIEDGVAIYDCSHTPDQTWADQVVKIGSCTSHEQITANTVLDENTDYEMELILLIGDLYNGEAETGGGENEF